MRKSVLRALAVCTLAPALLAQERGQFVISMHDADGKPVATFGPKDLEVFENGQPAPIVKVEPYQSAPLRVVLAIDNGDKMSDYLVHVRAAAKEFFAALPEGTEAALVTTAPQGQFFVKATTDRDALLRGVDNVTRTPGGGRFIESLGDVARNWKRQKGEYRSVLVSLGSTFAIESPNKRYVEESVNSLVELGATVHVVMFRPADATAGDHQFEVGQQVAGVTRGRFENIGAYQQLSVLAEIAKQLAAESSGGEFLVTVQRPEGATGRLGPLSYSPNTGMVPGRIKRLP